MWITFFIPILGIHLVTFRLTLMTFLGLEEMDINRCVADRFKTKSCLSERARGGWRVGYWHTDKTIHSAFLSSNRMVFPATQQWLGFKTIIRCFAWEACMNISGIRFTSTLWSKLRACLKCLDQIAIAGILQRDEYLQHTPIRFFL